MYTKIFYNVTSGTLPLITPIEEINRAVNEWVETHKEQYKVMNISPLNTVVDSTTGMRYLIISVVYVHR